MILKLTRCYWRFPQGTTVVGIHTYIFPDVSIIREIHKNSVPCIIGTHHSRTLMYINQAGIPQHHRVVYLIVPRLSGYQDDFQFYFHKGANIKILNYTLKTS